MKRRLLIIALGLSVLMTVPAQAADLNSAHALAEDYLQYSVNVETVNEEMTVEQITEEVGAEYGISPELLQAIIHQESRGNADAKNGSCKGLMQVSARWHTSRAKELGQGTDLYDPQVNIRTGCDYLSDCFEAAQEAGYGDDVYLALMMYNEGISGGRNRYRKGITSTYAKEVVQKAAELEREHGK